MSTVVADSSPLIALAKIEQFHLLRRLFERIVVPDAVWIEVVVRGEGKPASALVLSAHQEGWIQRQRARNVLAVTLLRANLGPGEAEAIVLAQEIKAMWVLLDDDLARAYATGIGLRVKGTVGVLLAAYQAGFLSDLRGTMDELRAKGFWLSERVYQRILAESGVS